MGVNDFIQIGSRIKEERLKAEPKISQKEMAELLHIPVTTYSSYENNHREPNSDIIKKITEILGITIPYLLYGTENEDEYTNFQAFIDYCYTLGYSVESCVSDPSLSGEYYIRLENDVFYTLTPEEINRIMQSSEDYIQYLFKKALEGKESF